MFLLGLDGKISYLLMKTKKWTDQMAFAFSGMPCEIPNLLFFFSKRPFGVGSLMEWAGFAGNGKTLICPFEVA